MTRDDRPTRRNQLGVRDPLATPDQLKARAGGMYDPRPASGKFVALRVKLLCVRCGRHLGVVAEFEHRTLFHSLSRSTWSRDPSGMKCSCFNPMEPFPVDLDAVDAGVTAARHAGRSRSVKIGSKPSKLR